MARLEYTAIVSSIRGKLNGNVFTRNKGGEVLRNKVTPINPSTAYQSQQRAFTALIAKAYPGLTDAQRSAWRAFGQTNEVKSVFGNNMIVSGIASFQRINKITLASGGSLISNPPSSLNVSNLTSLTLTANHIGNILTIAFAPTPLVAPEGLYIFATPPLSPGIGNASTYLRLIGYFSAAASGVSISAAWQTRFGSFPGTSGKRIAITANVVNINTGAISAAVGASTLIL